MTSEKWQIANWGHTAQEQTQVQGSRAYFILPENTNGSPQKYAELPFESKVILLFLRQILTSRKKITPVISIW